MGDPLDELKRIADAEKAKARAESEQRSASERRERETKTRKEAARARSRRAAPGFLGSMRFFALMGAAMLIAVGFFVTLLEESVAATSWVAVPASVWAVVFALAWLDAATWRRRLPFRLEGEREVLGDDETGTDEVPWVAYEITLVARDGVAHPAIARTLEILVGRVNAQMFADDEAGFGGGRVWRVSGEASARGEASLAVYTTRTLEKWLRREVRLLHRAVPLALVRVHAKYTGSSYRTSSSD